MQPETEVPQENAMPNAAAMGSCGLIQEGIFLFTMPVVAQTVHPVIEWILVENMVAERRKFLQLIICCPGGEVNAGFALVDVMAASSVPIRTTGIGMIASCGLMIFMAGQKGHRTITPNTNILSHQYSWGGEGKEHELIARQRAYKLSSKRMMDHYRKHTKLSVEKIRKELMPAEDRWLSAREAVKFNLADKIKKLGT